MKVIKSGLFALLAIIGFTACGPSGEKVEVKNLNLELTAVGPLFEGPNTATFDWKVDFENYLDSKPNEITSAQIKAVRIKAIGYDLGATARQFVLQLAANGVDMQKIAHTAEVSGEEGIANLQVAEKQDDIEKFFNQETMTFVLDFDYLEEESFEDLNFSIEIDLEMTVK